MNEHTEVRVTKWLQKCHYNWCVEEGRRIKESTGDQCRIANEKRGKDDMIALIRMMSTK